MVGIQHQLKALGYKVGGVLGLFTEQVEESVKEFQRTHGLVPDGIVGPKTSRALLTADMTNHHSPPVVSVAEPLTTHYSVPVGLEEALKRYGDPRPAPAVWKSQNLVEAKVPEGLRLTGSSRPVSRIACHRLVKGALERALSKVAERGLTQFLTTFHGSWVIRNVRGSVGLTTGGSVELTTGRSTLSIHALGAAFDFNLEGNELGNPRPAMDRPVVACFEEEGFEWGGRWRRKDGMHFQLVWTQGQLRRVGGKRFLVVVNAPGSAGTTTGR